MAMPRAPFMPDFMPQIKQHGEVVFQPETAEHFRRGTALITRAIRPTLGPRPRRVANALYGSGVSPEILDSGGLIARRITNLADPYQNMGAMFLRGALWRLHEAAGDGTATAAVLFQSIFEPGLKLLAAGWNAMLLRRHLETGMTLILDQLESATLPLDSSVALADVAHSVCYETALADEIGAVMAYVGEYGAVDVQPGHQRAATYTLYEGSYWPGGVLVPQLLDGYPGLRAKLEPVHLLLTDFEIDDPQTLHPVLRAAVQARVQNLVIVAKKISALVQGVIASSQRSGKLRLMAAKTPFQSFDDQMLALDDLCVLTGGRALRAPAGDTLEQITPAHFGRAQTVWVDQAYLGVLGGAGEAQGVADQVSSLKRTCAGAEKNEAREKSRERAGRLLGKMAVLDVGGDTESEMKLRQGLAKTTITAVRGALAGGVLPGGGMALLACRPRLLAAMKTATDEHAKAALRLLAEAVAIPFQTLVENAGFDSHVVAANLEVAGAGYFFDTLKERVKPFAEGGVYDIAAAQMAAVRSAISNVALALTVEALVLPKHPQATTEPD